MAHPERPCADREQQKSPASKVLKNQWRLNFYQVSGCEVDCNKGCGSGQPWGRGESGRRTFVNKD